MTESYVKLTIATLLPVLAAALLFLLDKKSGFGKIKPAVKQLIFGVVFGGLAILGTEWGIPLNGAMVNCRDGAVLIAGLMFGAPAGILAGVIGGVERWIAVAWGVGTFTRVACSISTVLAGFYAAALRKFMFENKKPGWFISLCIGVVMEVFHLTMVFLTNMGTPEKAMSVVTVCTAPLVIANSAAVLLASIVLSLLSEEPLRKKKSGTRISQVIQKRMLITVVVAFVATSLFVFDLQKEIAYVQADNLLTIAQEDITADIADTSNENLLAVTRKVAKKVENGVTDLDALAEEYDVADIYLVDKNGIITDSTTSGKEYIGADMSSHAQSAEFMVLLGDTEEFVQDYGPLANNQNVWRKFAGVKTSTGFLQVSYDASRLQKDISSNTLNLTKNRHIGETGYSLIMDANFLIISAPDTVSPGALQSDLVKINTNAKNNTFSITLNGEDCFARYSTTEGYYVLSVFPKEEAYQIRNIVVFVNTFMEILVFALLFALIYLLIKRIVVNQIKSINTSLAKIASGDLNETVNVRSNEEFASLSDDINQTVDTLKHYIDEASARIDKELEFAKNIQASALPSVLSAFPKRKDFEIYALMNAAREVGGDFYDFYITNQDTLHFLVADVSGKGIPAAMFMMRAKTELKSLTEADLPPCDVFTRGNNALCEGNDAGMFVTAWQGSVDLESGILRYANAGHNPPVVRHANGQFEFLRTRAGFVLAGMEDVHYKSQEFSLTPGDIVFLYTDGVTEATNAQNELYGESRLQAILNSREFDSMQEVCDTVVADVDAFVGDAPQFDDITMVAFRYIGTPPVPTIRFEEATLQNINDVTSFVESELEKLGCSMKTVIQINIVIDELFSNIVRYGYKNTKGPVTVKIIEKEDPHSVCIRFEDEGIPYNPVQKEDPDITLNAEEREIGGLGIFMVKKTMDDMRYKYEDGKNILTVIKRLED